VRALANEFVFGVHDRIQTLPGSTEARRALVQTALTYLENLREDAAGDAGLALELAAAYMKVARVQGDPLRSQPRRAQGGCRELRPRARAAGPARGHRALPSRAALPPSTRASTSSLKG